MSLFIFTGSGDIWSDFVTYYRHNVSQKHTTEQTDVALHDVTKQVNQTYWS